MTPSPLTQGEIDVLQQRLSLFATFCLDDEFAGLLERYVDQTRTQSDGTLDAVLPHFMSIGDMRKAQVNLRYLRAVAENVLAVRSLAKQHLRVEADRLVGKESR